MIIFKALLASLTATYTAFAMECFLDVADSPHLTEIPHTLSCPCQATTEVFSIRDNIYSGALERELVRNIETVSISDCDTLILDFSDTMENKTIDLAGEKGLLDIKVLNVKNLELTLGGRNDIHILDKIFFTNVSHIETSFTKEYFESGGDKREESSFQSISDDSQVRRSKIKSYNRRPKIFRW